MEIYRLLLLLLPVIVLKTGYLIKITGSLSFLDARFYMCTVYMCNFCVWIQMLTKLSKQLNGEDWTWNNLNTLCWAIGSISGSMVEEQVGLCVFFFSFSLHLFHDYLLTSHANLILIWDFIHYNFLDLACMLPMVHYHAQYVGSLRLKIAKFLVFIILCVKNNNIL